MKTVFLYSTDGCHLCEDAKTICASLNIQPELVDIVEDDQLVEAYGDKIPVIMVEGAEQALFWPFGEFELTQYLSYFNK